jgi:hypothetical protein
MLAEDLLGAVAVGLGTGGIGKIRLRCEQQSLVGEGGVLEEAIG